MASFVNPTDYKPYITDNRLNQIIKQDETILDDAELTAVAVVKDALFARYDSNFIFARTGAARDRQVLRWCINLVMYYIYERVPDKLTPDRVLKNYNDTLLILKDIEDGKKSVDLARKVSDEGTTATKFRWGSQTPRTHT